MSETSFRLAAKIAKELDELAFEALTTAVIDLANAGLSTKDLVEIVYAASVYVERTKPRASAEVERLLVRSLKARGTS